MNKFEGVFLVSVFVFAFGVGALVYPFVTAGQGGLLVSKFEVHAWVQQYRGGQLVSETYHPMSVTNGGKDWVEQQLFNPNATCKALYIGLSNSTDSFSAAWTSIPTEYVTGNLTRATGVYASTGVGTANVTYTFAPSLSASTQLYGLYYDPTTASLLAAEQQGAGAAKNLVSGDTLKVTVQWSHS